MTPPRPILRLGWAIHRALFRVTGGRVGAERAGEGLGTLFLLSTGRRSGKVRRNALFFIKHGTDLVVVASNAGADADPGWWRNLQATPEAQVMIGPQPIPVRARRASAEDLARLWPRLIAANPEYAAYRAKAAREIPVVILEPR
jgi:deazaflavin-dependent oxidoreductase (nitroreductase family)